MNNVIIVEKGTKKEKLKDQLKPFKTSNKFPAPKFCGEIAINDDPLKIQKRLRNEWR